MQNRNYRIGLYEKAMPKDLDWNVKFRTAKECGYDYIELSIDETDEKLERLDWTDDRISELIADGSREGMSIGSICLSGQRKYPLGGEDERKSLEIIDKAIRFASAAGIPVIQMAGYDVYYSESTEKTRDRFIKNLEKCTRTASKEGILLGFETMETPFMDTVQKAMDYVLQVSSPYLGVYPDIGNLNNAALLYKHDILDDIDRGRGHILAVHIKETVPGRYREVPFGTGMVDFPRVLEKMWRLGVRRYVTELWYTGNENWKDCICGANSLATGILDKM